MHVKFNNQHLGTGDSKVRVLHAAAFLKPSSGIVQQMKWEKMAASSLGLNWQVIIYSTESLGSSLSTILLLEKLCSHLNLRRIKNIIELFILRLNFYRWLESIEDNVDIYLLRYSLYDIQQLRFISKSKKPVYLVHHTLEIKELSLQRGALGYLKVIAESWLGKKSIKKSSVTVGVTKEIVDFEIARSQQIGRHSIIYPNGVIYDDRVLADRRTIIPEIIFVASMFLPWIGLDLLLDEMSNNTDEFCLHLVGQLNEKDYELAIQDKRIIIHGHKNADEIEKISESCWIGLSSFGLFRKGMTEACALKVRDYLRMGLPVFSGYQETLPSNFKYYRNSKLSIEGILNFAFENRNVTRKEVSISARPYIDKIELLKRLAEQMKY